MSQRILTGITPSGIPHIGNYIGCILPALASQQDSNQHFYFIADLHSLVKQWDATQRQKDIIEVAATWLALGLVFRPTADVKKSWTCSGSGKIRCWRLALGWWCSSRALDESDFERPPTRPP